MLGQNVQLTSLSGAGIVFLAKVKFNRPNMLLEMTVKHHLMEKNAMFWAVISAFVVLCFLDIFNDYNRLNLIIVMFLRGLYKNDSG